MNWDCILKDSTGKELMYIARINIHLPFKYISIENTSKCNRKCSYCPNDMFGRPEIFMSESLYHKIIDELYELKYHGRINYCFYGEPLLDTRLIDFIRYAHLKLPRSELIINSNGDFLNEKLFYSLASAGMSMLIVSRHDGKPIKKIAHSKIIYLNFYDDSQKLTNRGGLLNISHDRRYIEPQINCQRQEQPIITATGNMILCCNDYNETTVFGNVNNERIIDIWNKKNYERIRARIVTGRYDYVLCQKCRSLDTFQDSRRNAYGQTECNI